MKKKKYYLMSPFLFIGSMLSIIFSGAGALHAFLSFINNAKKLQCLNFNADGSWLVVVMFFLFALTIILDGREIISYYRVENGVFYLYSPLLKTWKIDLKECVDIGIDYGVISGGMKQYWFYFSMDPIPKKYFHRINRLKYTKRCMRVQFNDKAYNVILQNSPPEVQRKLRNAYSVIENQRKKAGDDTLS